MFEKILIQNGFSEKEAAVAVALLELGEAPISQIAKRSGLKRTTVYNVIDGLQKKGTVTSLKQKGIWYFSILPPKLLVDRFKQAALIAEQALPDLLQLADRSFIKPRIRFFDGIEGIKKILQEFSYSKIPSMGFTDYSKMPPELFRFIRQVIVPERKLRKHAARLIAPDNTLNRQIKSQDKKSLTEYRLIHFPETQENLTELLLFEESKIAFFSFKREEMFGFILDSKASYEILKNIFLMLWNMTINKFRIHSASSGQV